MINLSIFANKKASERKFPENYSLIADEKEKHIQEYFGSKSRLKIKDFLC
jgi:hypothetical protein